MEVKTDDDRQISIHALHEESDVTTSNFNVYYKPKFQSTLSMRRATLLCTYPRTLSTFQSTLSMRRATYQLSTMFPELQ